VRLVLAVYATVPWRGVWSYEEGETFSLEVALSKFGGSSTVGVAGESEKVGDIVDIGRV